MHACWALLACLAWPCFLGECGSQTGLELPLRQVPPTPFKTTRPHIPTDPPPACHAGLYRGTVITSIRDVPSYGVYYSFFELCRELLDPGSRQRRSSSPATLWAAGEKGGLL
jgi:hypothetical protein